MDHPITTEQVETRIAIHSPRVEFFQHISRDYNGAALQFIRVRALFFGRRIGNDWGLEPDIVRKAQKRYVQVELAGQHTRSYTAVDRRDRTGHEPNVNLMLEVDIQRVGDLMPAAVE